MRNDFEVATYNNDLALIKMDRPVVFNEAVRPLCLASTSEDYGGQLGDILGWGRLSYDGDLPLKLQEATVPILTLDQCRYKSQLTIFLT